MSNKLVIMIYGI